LYTAQPSKVELTITISTKLVYLLSMRREPTLKAYKYRIYPTDTQVVFFAKTFGCCRFVWNKMLDKKLHAYKKKERIPQDTPAKYEEEFPFLKEVDSFALCNVQLQLEKAFKDHFKNRKQFKLPKFKKEKDKQSYTTNNTHNSIRVDFESRPLLSILKALPPLRVQK
jgi:putative transposase